MCCAAVGGQQLVHLLAAVRRRIDQVPRRTRGDCQVCELSCLRASLRKKGFAASFFEGDGAAEPSRSQACSYVGPLGLNPKSPKP